MTLTYTTRGDYQIPDLTAPEMPTIGKYGMLRQIYLQEHKNGIYAGLLMSGKLSSHLMEIDKQAKEQVELITSQMAKSQGVTEQLKSTDQMKWVQMMNNIKNSAEEIVLNQLIYN